MKTKISISMPEKMAKDLKKLMKREKYSSMSEFVEKLLTEKFKIKKVLK